MDIGFELAGFSVIWGNEVSEATAAMYAAGLESWRSSRNGKSTRASMPLIVKNVETLTVQGIEKQAFGSVKPEFFGVIGGPPCQDFSHSGTDLGINGDRGKLTQVYVDLILGLTPSFFVMENVPGLYRTKHRPFFQKIIEQLENSKPGYLTDFQILSALELGLPQDRERLFLIGFRKDLLSPSLVNRPLLDKQCRWFPWPAKKYRNPKKLPWPTTSPFGVEDIPLPQNLPVDLMVCDLLDDRVEALPNGLEIFRPRSDKFPRIPEGDVSGKSFKRLHRYRYSPTVWYGNNEVHLHPWKPRRLSIREALRLQTVPDEYVLPSDFPLTQKFRIISNGVPTRMAEHVAKSVKQFADEMELLD